MLTPTDNDIALARGGSSASRCGACHWWVANVGCCCAVSPLRSRDPHLCCAEFESVSPDKPYSNLSANFYTRWDKARPNQASG